MAEAVVLDVAKNILSSLSPLARQTVAELWGIKDELEKLRKTVSTVQAVLLHSEEQYHQSPQVKEWVAQLKDALCDAEDLLGYFYVESRLKDLRSQNKIMKEVSTFFSSSNQLVQRFKMASKLKEVRMKIDVIKDARNFHLDERLKDREVRITTRRQENEHSFIPMKEIIGRDDEKKEIRKLLLQDFDREENVSVVSIVGIGGLGKTALAQCVFNEEDVKNHFEPRIWVTVSDDFNIKKIAEKIIASAKDVERPKHFEMEQMQSRLRKEIDGKRYLLVLDDLWNENREEWLKLKILLDGGAKGSKILITARSSVVAEISGAVNNHALQGLETSASLDLFRRCASSEGQKIPKSVKDSVGEKVVEKCSGVPLAIRVIGGMLFLKKTEAEWLYFKDIELQNITFKENDITDVLKLSYDHLPSYLKQCFAFCSLFPKDYEIEKSTLTFLWIAQGFIQQSLDEDLDVEQKAHGSFMYLLDRSFFQDRVDDDLGNVRACKMHDLMHDLACRVAGSGCNVMGPNRRGTLHGNALRHLSYPSNETLLDEFPKLQPENMKVRTLMSTYNGTYFDTTLPKLTCIKLMSSLKHLRALTVHYTDMEEVPSFLCKLKLLSYLDLSYNDGLKRLPNSIKSLQNMTTLILIRCNGLRELPRDIVELDRLTNLRLDRFYWMKSMPRGLGRVTSLRTLTHFIVGGDGCMTKNCAKLHELRGLNNLRTELNIEMAGYIKNAAVESKSANLKGKQFLDTLHLRWSAQEHDKHNEAELITNHEALLEGLQPHANLRKLEIDIYNGTKFPRWMMEDLALCLPNLVEVAIINCRKCRYLPTLGLLPHLRKLHLYGLDEAESVGISIHESSSSNLATSSPLFPSLLDLDIGSCPKLKSIPPIENVRKLHLSDVSAELVKQSFDLHLLEYLSIFNIKYLDSLPDWLQHCTNLKNLQIMICNDLTSLPESMTQLGSLEVLSIDECNKLVALPDQMGGLAFLRELEIKRCPNLTSLPESMTKLKSLQKLGIWQCPRLVALPERIGELASLNLLEIMDCEKLTSLPESMTQLKSLQKLEIWRCAQLKEKCKREIGEEWYKIKHIPTIYIDHQEGDMGSCAVM